MRGDPVTVRLVTDALHEVQSLRVTRQNQRCTVMREEDFLFLFCQPHHGNFIKQVKLFEDFDHATQLTLAAIDDDEIGQKGKGRIRLGPGTCLSFL